MTTDVPDLQFACKEVCREMSAHTSVQPRKKVKTRRQVPLGPEKVVWMFFVAKRSLEIKGSVI